MQLSQDSKTVWLYCFKKFYLNDRAPSIHSCWIKVLGCAMQWDSTITPENFPCERTFINWLNKEVSEKAQYLARHTFSAWCKKYQGKAA
jgi:hypothetical protein